MRMRFVMCACLMMAALVVSPAYSAQSTFDADLEGWTSNTPAEVLWAGTGGNPGGYARFEDVLSESTFLIAPAPFLGDWSGLDGWGVLSYDHKVFQAGNYSEAWAYEVRISGPGGSANWTGAAPTGPTDWMPQVIPIRQDAWSVQSGTWSGLLGSVDTLWISIEQFSSLSGPQEICGIDNVQLVPEPSSLFALICALGGLGAAWRRRR